jgi:O-antigen/teichoic acid export membrane protein
MMDSGPSPANPAGNNAHLTSRKHLLRNAVYSSGSWIANVLVVMLATPFIVSKLGSDGYGVYALLTGLVGYYGLLDFGLGQGVTKYVAQFEAMGDRDGVYRSINAALWVQAIAGFAGSALVVAFAGPILQVFDIPPPLLAPSKTGLYITACGFFFTMLSGTFSSALMGLQKYTLIGKTNVLLNVTLTCLILLALVFGGGLLAAVILTAISALVMFWVYYSLLRSNLAGYRFSTAFDLGFLKTLASFSGYLFISKVSSTFGLYVVRFIVGYFLGPIGVTYFVIPSKLISAVGGLLGNAFGVLFPYSSAMSASDNLHAIQKTVLETSKYLASLSIPMFLFISLFSRTLMTMWMGADFAEHTWLILTLLSFGSLFGSLTSVPNLITMGLGHTRIVGLFSIISLAFSMVFTPLLTASFGLIGTGWAIVLSSLPGLALVAFELRRVFFVKFLHYWRQVLGVHLIPVLLVGLICQPLNSSGHAVGLLSNGVAAAGFLIYCWLLVFRGYIPIGQWSRDFFLRG